MMKPEQNLLLELLGKARESEIAGFLAENPDWEFFIETADENRVVPLVFQKLRPFFDRLPPEIFDSLQSRAQICAASNLNFNTQLLKLARTLEENEIEFLSYKGATLAQIAYGDSSLRQFGDLDFLIRKKDFATVKKLILETGGRCAWKLSEKQEKAVLKRYYEFPFRFGKNSVLIEVHWAFTEPFFGFDYNVEDVFRRRQKIEVRGRNFPTLSSEDLLLVLCVHGSKHYWKRLSWICDVGKLVETQPIRWNKVVELAGKFGCARMLALGLLLAKDLLKIDLPEAARRLIENDKEIEPLAEELKEQMFDDRFSSDTIRTDIHLKMRERLSDKIKYSRRLLATKLVDSLFMPMGRPQ